MKLRQGDLEATDISDLEHLGPGYGHSKLVLRVGLGPGLGIPTNKPPGDGIETYPS